MKLISETVEHVQPLIVEESGVKGYFIEGPFLQAELKNKNGRIYPLKILEREVERYTRELINENRALGELGHPDSPSINLDRVSHLIISLRQEGTNFIGRAKIMDTPYGKIVKSLIDEKVKLGVSTRGLGTMRQTSQGSVVSDDFYLATAADIVSDPSAPNAFVQGIMENREWIWNNGILTERQIAQYRRELDRIPTRRATDKRVDEVKLFDRFMRDIRVVSKGQSPTVVEQKTVSRPKISESKLLKAMKGIKVVVEGSELKVGDKVRTKTAKAVRWAGTGEGNIMVPAGTLGRVVRTYTEYGDPKVVVNVGRYDSLVFNPEQLTYVP